MSEIAGSLAELYQHSPLWYAVAATLGVVILGTVLGFIMDWAGRKLGADTAEVDHHRETV